MVDEKTTGGASKGTPPLAPAMSGKPPGEVGLSAEEVRQRVIAGQVNAPPPSPGRTIGQIVRANVLTRFNAILGSLFVVVAIVGPIQDGLFGVVVLANTTIGIIQELRAKWTLDRLAILTAPRAHALRGGSSAEPVVSDIDVEDVVVDDLLELRPGDQVPVDGVVIGCSGLEVDESLLSGEPEAVAKATGETVLSGSFVVAGSGMVRTTAVGAAAYATQLQAQAVRFSLLHSELQAGTNSILRMVTWVMIPAGVALTVSQLVRSHQSLADALRGSVAGVGAMVPEGLVLLTSIAFAVGAIRLARRRVLVQELAAIEGLARTDILCIDKTGTLTAGGATLEAIAVASGHDEASVHDAVGAMAATDPAPNATMQALAQGFDQPPNWVVAGRVPFSSDRKWSAVTFADHGSWVLGAPDILSSELPAELERERSRHEGASHRVLLLARTGESIQAGNGLADLVPVALVVLSEQLRDEAASTIAYLSDQGVTVTVLSGDAPATVAAIASKVGIPLVGCPCDASKLAADDTSMATALSSANIFGRVRPDQKVAAVRALQAQGHVVAMIGDGVNDVQALKQADLGIAMGSGSQASRSVARMVLLDDSFAAVPQVLSEGRRVVANIERVANLFVTKTVYAAILAVVVAVGGFPFPFFPRHLTIVSTLTIGIPGFFLALARGAPRASPGFVAKVLAFTIPAGVFAATATLAVYALARLGPNTSGTQQRTAAMLELAAVAFAVLVLVARPLNAPRIALVVSMTLGLVTLIVLAKSRSIFDLQLPGLQVILGATVIGAVAIVLLVVSQRWAGAWVRGHRPPDATVRDRPHSVHPIEDVRP